ncbi:MAG TPA: helix-turn-helix transcriptional regulator, partial [Flavobacteriales bacterium]|nr:helix-turn-helix transcriptional regulator [Flavobacteriales bacterium]
KVLEHFRANSPADRNVPDPGLSEREKSVLTLLVKGRSYKMIADDLAISYHTVDSHMRRIYEKLHVHNGAEAVSKAVKDGLI